MSKVDQLVADIHREFKTFRLIPKERSLVMKIIFYGTLMFLWCPNFMSGYTTVLITWVYMPESRIGSESSYTTLRHERVHMRDCFRSGILPFVISYLFLLPAVFTLRAIWEMRAYAETMRAELEQTGRISDMTVQHIADQFTSSSYFFMFPFPRYVKTWTERVRRQILAEPRQGKTNLD